MGAERRQSYFFQDYLEHRASSSSPFPGIPRNAHGPLFTLSPEDLRAYVNSLGDSNDLNQRFWGQNDAGFTPVHEAVALPSVEHLKVLLEFPAGLNCLSIGTNPNGWLIGGVLPLHLASHLGRPDMVEALLRTDQGLATLHAVDSAGHNALHWTTFRWTHFLSFDSRTVQ